jgi:segregation and condensation protein B
MMETLAIVAYRGPIARSGIEAVRGVACGELLRQLMERDLIRIAGRSEELGRPYLYGTTKGFLQLFGLANLDSLPPIQWQTLHEDMSDSPTSNVSSSNSSPSNPPKEPVVSTLIAPEPNSLNSNIETAADIETLDPIVADSATDHSVAIADPAAVIEDEEDDLYEGINDDDDDDWDDEDDDEGDDDEEDDEDWD